MAFWDANYSNPYGLSTPQAPSYQSNPNAYQGYNRTQLLGRALSGIGSDTGNSIRNAQNNAVASNGGRSASNLRTMQDANAQGQGAMANARNQAGELSYQEQLAQMNAANQFAQQNYQTQSGIYGNQLSNAQKQQEGLNKLIGTAFPGQGGALGQVAMTALPLFGL